jgi:hypothetical protein
MGGMMIRDGQTRPQKDAFDLVLALYRREHGEYLRRKQTLNFVIGGGLTAAPLWILLLAAHVFWGWLKGLSGRLNPTAYLSILAVVFLGWLCYTWLQVRQARKLLDAAKINIDSVGCYVVCDLTRHVYDPRLVLTDTTPPGVEGIVFRPFEPIDFGRYDRAFRVH